MLRRFAAGSRVRGRAAKAALQADRRSAVAGGSTPPARPHGRAPAAAKRRTCSAAPPREPTNLHSAIQWPPSRSLPMRVSRRKFMASSAAVSALAASGCAPGQAPAEAQTAAACGRSVRRYGRADRRAQRVSGQGDADRGRRAPSADREGAQADGRERHGRDDPRAEHEHVVFRERALGPERAAVPPRDPGEGRARRMSAPGFEETRAREITKFTDDVRVWQEDEDWGKVVAGILKDRGVVDRQGRHRRAAALLHRRRHPRGGAGHPARRSARRSPPAAA